MYEQVPNSLEVFMHLIKILRTSLVAFSLGAALFPAIEPVVGIAMEDQFTVSQTITDEISFTTPATNVTMSPSLSGLTGGTSNGGTQVVVTTNNSSGYSMTLTASGTPAMQGNTQGGSIPDYTPGTANVPDYTFAVAANRAEFGYTIEASTTLDLDPKFLDDGASNCNTGSSDTADSCWLNASTTAVTVVNRNSETTGSGSTTTLKFRITINSNPVPSIAEDIYTATSTLTAVNN